MKTVVISCSLHPASRSFVLAKQVVEDLRSLDMETELYDLREYPLVFSDVSSAREAPEAQPVITAIREASTVLLAVPIYCYDVNAAARNLLELAGRAWNQTLVGFLCAAGGRSSYMSCMSLANCLMLDYRCIIIPRFVYAVGDDFGDDRLETMYIANEEIRRRISELAQTTANLTCALDGVDKGT